MVRLVVQEAYNKYPRNVKFLDLLDQYVLSHYGDDGFSRAGMDGFLWACKSWANSRMEKYKDTVTLVASAFEGENIYEKLVGYSRLFK
ncbi:MAG: hypothetical protein ACI9NY_000196 [Kiritimatiellia bacterium]|jgi:hypothetical protein